MILRQSLSPQCAPCQKKTNKGGSSQPVLIPTHPWADLVTRSILWHVFLSFMSTCWNQTIGAKKRKLDRPQIQRCFRRPNKSNIGGEGRGRVNKVSSVIPALFFAVVFLEFAGNSDACLCLGMWVYVRTFYCNHAGTITVCNQTPDICPNGPTATIRAMRKTVHFSQWHSSLFLYKISRSEKIPNI